MRLTPKSTFRLASNSQGQSVGARGVCSALPPYVPRLAPRHPAQARAGRGEPPAALRARAHLEQRKAALQTQLLRATGDHNALRARARAHRTAKALAAAERLLNCLRPEQERWRTRAECLAERRVRLLGDARQRPLSRTPAPLDGAARELVRRQGRNVRRRELALERVQAALVLC